MKTFIFTFCLFVIVGLILSRSLKKKAEAKKCADGTGCGACRNTAGKLS